MRLLRRISQAVIMEQEKKEGTILNRRNVGKTPDELVALWNEDHPDDPVTD